MERRGGGNRKEQMERERRAVNWRRKIGENRTKLEEEKTSRVKKALGMTEEEESQISLLETNVNTLLTNHMEVAQLMLQFNRGHIVTTVFL